MKENLKEGNLRKWFQDGGWNRYNTKGEKVGKCARDDKDGDGKADGPKPKCLPASRAASLGKKKIAAAVKRKRREDPNPDRTGAAKNVKTVSKKNEEFDMEIQESDKKGKGSGKKDACYHKVKRTAKVWPSAYASGRLVQCRKKGAANYGNSKNEEFMALPEFSDIQINSMRAAGIEVEVLDEKCWKGYEKKGMKTMFGKRYPNCVKKEETEVTKEGVLDAALETDKKMGELHKKVDNDVKRMKKGKKFKEELEGNLKEMSSEKDINKKLQKKVNSKDLNPSEYIKNTRLMPGSGIIKKLPEGNAGPSTPVKQYDGKFMPNPGAGRPGKVRLKPGTPAALRLAHKEYSDWRTELFEGDGDHEYEMARRQLATIKNAVSRLEKKMGETGEGELKAWVQSKLTRSADDIDTVADYMTNEENIQEGEKDACYHKVKSRYSVWPSAYASGALVKCRKVGAKNWGNKTKKEEIQYMNTEDYQRIQEYGNVYTIIVLWRGKSHRLQLFFQGTARPSRDEVKNEVEKIYPGGMVSYYFPSATDPGKPIIVSTRS